MVRRLEVVFVRSGLKGSDVLFLEYVQYTYIVRPSQVRRRSFVRLPSVVGCMVVRF